MLITRRGFLRGVLATIGVALVGRGDTWVTMSGRAKDHRLFIDNWRGYPATYFVSRHGDDANDGSAVAPWRTLDKAARTVQSGDTVMIGGGPYREHYVQGGVNLETDVQI